MCAQVASIGLHDDMEEDLVGTDWHQRAISSLYTSLSNVAQRAGLPWHVGNQLTLIVWKPDGTAWRPSPDIMIHPQDRLRVFDRAGKPMPYEYEKTWELAERERMIAERARVAAEWERILAERDAEIARLSAKLERAPQRTGQTPLNTALGDASDTGDDGR